MFRSGFSLRVCDPVGCANGCAVRWQGWGCILTVPLPDSATAEESVCFLADELQDRQMNRSMEQEISLGFTGCICVLKRAMCCHLSSVKIKLYVDSLLSSFLSG